MRIIVVGSSHHNTLSVLRCLGEVYGQLEVILVGCKSSFIAKSKFARTITYVDNVIELYHLIRHYEVGVRTVFISCSDSVSQMFDSHFCELSNRFDFFNAGVEGRLTFMMDKQRQVDLARESGFLTPYSSCYTNGGEICSFNRFPCIVKPLQSYVGGKSIMICNSISELRSVVSELPVGVEFQVQELISKKHEIVLPGLITSNNFIIPGYIKKHRDFLGATTYSSVKQHDNLTLQLVLYAERMLRDIGYIGLFGIEAIFDGSNYLFIELNLRNDATCYSISVAGVNLPSLYIESLKKDNVSVPAHINEITSIVENKDFSHVLDGKLSIIQWIKELRNAECKFLYHRKDLKPLFACIIEQVSSKLHL